MTLLRLSALALGLTLVAACEPIDTSALEEIEKTAANARQTVETVNARGAEIQQAVEDPVGALTAAVTAELSRSPTNEPGVWVLTDLSTGCQFLATYAADGRTVSSIAPRVAQSPDGQPRQRCIVQGAAADAEG